MLYVTNDKIVDVRYVNCSKEFDNVTDQIECKLRQEMA